MPETTPVPPSPPPTWARPAASVALGLAVLAGMIVLAVFGIPLRGPGPAAPAMPPPGTAPAPIPGPDPRSPSPRRALRVCVPRVLPAASQVAAALMAVAANPANAPSGGAGSGALSIASVTAKRWKPGSTITVGFRGGSAATQARVLAQMRRWSQVCQVDFALSPAGQVPAQRWGFDTSQGSWNYVGTDVLMIPADEPTGNLGWIDDTTDDTEVRRVVVHETGHLLGFLHEAQVGLATGELKLNPAPIYAYFEGPPNYWSRADVDQQILTPQSLAGVDHSPFDKLSIMEYWFDPSWIVPPTVIPTNTDLSPTDITESQAWYGPRGVAPLNPPAPPKPPPPQPGPTCSCPCTCPNPAPPGPAPPPDPPAVPLAVGGWAASVSPASGPARFSLSGPAGAVAVSVLVAAAHHGPIRATIAAPGSADAYELAVSPTGVATIPAFPGGPLVLAVYVGADGYGPLPTGTPLVVLASAAGAGSAAPRPARKV